MSTEDKRLKNLRPPWKPGESGNPRGGNHLQTLRAQLAKLEPAAMGYVKRVLDGKANTISYKVLRLYLSMA